MLRVVLFDFGGVLAEEGFREGLKAIAKRKGLDPEDFYKISADLVYQTGYITGGCDEHSYWNAVRKKTGVKGDDREFREEILKRFKLRREMTTVVRKIKSYGLLVAILSDQTNWLDELDQRTLSITISIMSSILSTSRKRRGTLRFSETSVTSWTFDRKKSSLWMTTWRM